MLVNCPKCGFQQPEDQYCAQCGVDMKAYVPEPEPLTKRLWENLAAQVFLVVFIIGGLFVSIYFSQKETIDQQIQKAFQSEESGLEAFEAATEDPGEASVASSQDAENPTLNAKQRSMVSPDRPVGDEGSVASQGTENISEIQVTYAEVPDPLLLAWSSEGQVLNETGQSRSLALANVSDVSSLRRQDWRPFVLPGGRNHTVNTSLAAREDFFRPVAGYESEIGFMLEVSPTAVSAEQVSFELQIILSLPVGMDDSVGTSTLTGRYTIPRGSALIIVGVLPKQSLSQEALTQFQDSPLVVLQSPEFLSGSSEFALILRPQ